MRTRSFQPVLMSTAVKQFIMPDLLGLCSIPTTGLNPRYDCDAYKKGTFIYGPFDLLTSYAYPYAGEEEFETCCVLINLLFVLDEYIDEQNSEDAGESSQIFTNALINEEWDNGSVVSRVTKDFRVRYFRRAKPETSRRFLKSCQTAIKSLVTETVLRERGEILGYDEYILHRRQNCGLPIAFGLFEYVLDINLPDEVVSNETFQKLYSTAIDLVSVPNDLYSYNMEQALGQEANNLVTVLMNTFNLGLQDAVDMLGVKFAELMTLYDTLKDNLPSWGEGVDRDVAKYVHALSCWIRGNLEWSFESQRYFGADHLKVKETRTVILRPPGKLKEDVEGVDIEGKVVKFYM